MQNLSTGLFTAVQCSSEKIDFFFFFFTKFNHMLLQGSFYHCLPLYKCRCLHQFITDTCDSAALFSCVIAWLFFLRSFLHALWRELFPIPVSFRERSSNYRNLNIMVVSHIIFISAGEMQCNQQIFLSRKKINLKTFL